MLFHKMQKVYIFFCFYGERAASSSICNPMYKKSKKTPQPVIMEEYDDIDGIIQSEKTPQPIFEEFYDDMDSIKPQKGKNAR